jgi:1-acyl-sn-glycerol-3-phosphate acyltransferase
VRPFQLGAFSAAVATGAPIIPVSLAGTRRFLRDGTFLPRPTSVTITLSPPLLPKISAPDSSDWHQVVRLRDAAREQIARHSGERLV